MYIYIYYVCVYNRSMNPSFQRFYIYRYRSYPTDPPARLTAGVSVSLDTTEPVEDLSLLRLIPPHLRDNIVQVSQLLSLYNNVWIHQGRTLVKIFRETIHLAVCSTFTARGVRGACCLD